jgi:hypothetical protein
MAWKAGHLVKRGHFAKTWKKRFFTVGGGKIKYYTDKNGALKGEVDLINTSLTYERREDKEVLGKRAFVFKILVGDGTSNRTSLMVAFSSEEEATSWGDIMRAVHMDSSGEIWLTTAAKTGDVEGIQTCLDAGVAVDELNRNRQTALLCACSAGQVECAKLLLSNGARTDILSQTGSSPVVMCVTDQDGVERPKQRECLRILLRAGANPNSTNNDGYTPLLLAVKAGRSNDVDLLLEECTPISSVVSLSTSGRDKGRGGGATRGSAGKVGAKAGTESGDGEGKGGEEDKQDKPKLDVDARGGDELTALMCAAQLGYTSVVLALLRTKACAVDCKVKVSSATAVVLAIEAQEYETMHALMVGGAKMSRWVNHRGQSIRAMIKSTGSLEGGKYFGLRRPTFHTQPMLSVEAAVAEEERSKESEAMESEATGTGARRVSKAEVEVEEGGGVTVSAGADAGAEYARLEVVLPEQCPWYEWTKDGKRLAESDLGHLVAGEEQAEDEAADGRRIRITTRPFAVPAQQLLRTSLSSLRIKAMCEELEGVYVCVARTAAGDTKSVPITIRMPQKERQTGQTETGQTEQAQGEAEEQAQGEAEEQEQQEEQEQELQEQELQEQEQEQEQELQEQEQELQEEEQEQQQNDIGSKGVGAAVGAAGSSELDRRASMPAGVQQHFDADRGRPFFLHTASGATGWTIDELLEESSSMPSSKGAPRSASPRSASPRSRARTASEIQAEVEADVPYCA